ncbi:dentin sialophosphoprotein [Microplitis demolitor]|uniref:dentin sialophosphoprotein n=1 Tax=Microplitis demolitor TaxID=69319 RepID=UPI0004CD99C8|nr:dentin sialophosphoprotein [Microplitis demolitor]
MARRKSLNRRRSRRSLNVSGILNDDTNAYEEDNDLWFDNLPNESNISKYRASDSRSRYSKSILNSDSQVVDSIGNDDKFWENLNKTSQDLFARENSAPVPGHSKSARKSNTLNETLTSEASTTHAIKKRKLLVPKNRKSTGDVFSQALDDSEPAVESEPVRSSARMIDRRSSHSQSDILDRNRSRRSGFQSAESASDNDRPAKRAVFKKPSQKNVSRTSVFDEVLNDPEESVVGPSQEPTNRKTFVKPRTTFFNSPRGSASQSRKSGSQQLGSNEDKDKDVDTDDDDTDDNLASQQRPFFRQHNRNSSNPFASIISESESEKDTASQPHSKSLDQSKRTGEQSVEPEVPEPEEIPEEPGDEEGLNEYEKSLASVENKTLVSKESENNFTLRDSAGSGHSDSRQSKNKDLMRKTLRRSSRVLSGQSGTSNKSSTSSLSEVYKTPDINQTDYQSYRTQYYEPIEDDDAGTFEADSERQNAGEHDLRLSQEIEKRERVNKNIEKDFDSNSPEVNENNFDDEDEDNIVDKENRESLNNLEDDVNFSQMRKRSGSGKSGSPTKAGDKKARVSADDIITGQQAKEITNADSSGRRMTRQSEGDKSTRNKSHVSQVDESVKSKKSVSVRMRSQSISEAASLIEQLGVEAGKDVSPSKSVRKTRSGKILEELETDIPEDAVLESAKDNRQSKSLKIVEISKHSTRVTIREEVGDEDREEDEVEAGVEDGEEQGLGNSTRKTRSRRVIEDSGDSSSDTSSVRKKRKEVSEKRQSILKSIVGSDSSDEQSESPGKASGKQPKSLIVEPPKYSSTRINDINKSSSRKDQDDEDEEEESQDVTESQDDEAQEEEEETQEEEENQNATKSQEDEENQNAVESQDTEENEAELISSRKPSKSLGSPKYSSTRYLNKTGVSFNEADSDDDIDEELNEYIKNTSKMCSSQNKSKKSIKINPTPSQLPFRESDSEESEDDNNLDGSKIGKTRSQISQTSTGKTSKVPEAVASTPGTARVNNRVSTKSRLSQPLGNQRSILSYFDNLNSRPSLHISTKPLESSDFLKEASARMKEIKKQQDELFAKQLEKNASVAKPVTSVPVKKKIGAGVGLKKKNSANVKVVDKAYIVNGQVYKRPRLPRPKHWATDRLYKFLWKKMEPKYQLQTRVRSEKFVKDLAVAVETIKKKKKYENYKFLLDDLLKKMARLGIIETRRDFYHFCYDFLPYEFREKVTPILHPNAVHLVPFEPDKVDVPILS